MRGVFADELYKHMNKNNNIVLITCDLGYKMWDKIRDEFPDRFYNVGAAEQVGLGIAVGMALLGKIVFVYSITPFLLFRGLETIRNYISHESIPIKLIGSGRGKDYIQDGFSHWVEDDVKILSRLPNINIVKPRNKEKIPKILNKMIETNKPFYLNLKR